MFTSHTYSIALLLMTLSMLWGTWANTQKITRNWPFELYYFDYTIGLLVLSLCIGLTLGRSDPLAPDSFVLNLRAASPRALWRAFAGGAIFSIGNSHALAASEPGCSIPWWRSRWPVRFLLGLTSIALAPIIK
jgi:glucose uptake protein